MVAQVQAFQDLINTTLADFIGSSNKIGEPLSTMAQLVLKAFNAELEFINYAITQKRPELETEIQSIVRPLSNAVNDIQKFRESNRGSAYFNNLSAISESAFALFWVSVPSKPAQFVKDLKESGQYYGNRVLSEHKNDELGDWIIIWYKLLSELEKYVRTYHLTGFGWGSAGSGSCPPPPPPPPIPPPELFNVSPMKDTSEERSALLRDLNQGTDITKRLKKLNVQDSSERKPVADKSPQKAQAKFATPQKVYPPKLALEGKKWCIEYQKNNPQIVIDQAQMSESLALYRCENSVVLLKNKVNFITIDGCKKTSVVVNDIISSIEVIHSDNIQIQCNGKVPLVNVDSSEGVQLFVANEAKDLELISSKSSSMNVCIIQPDGDYVEVAVPEQIKTTIVGNKLHSSIVEKI